MKRILIALGLLISVVSQAQQVQVGATIRRPTVNGVQNLSIDPVSGSLLLTPKSGPSKALPVDSSQVTGWASAFTQVRSQINLLGNDLTNRPLRSEIYTRTQADNVFHKNSWKPAWDNDILGKPSRFPSDSTLIPGWSSRMAGFLTRGEYQAFNSGVASTSATYSKTEANSLFAEKSGTQNALDSRYTKPQTDDKFFFSSAKDLAAAGGLTLVGNGSTDNRAALQYALLHPGPGNGVALPVGDYVLSGPVDVPANVHFIGSFGARIRVLQNFAPSQVSGNDGRYVFRVLAANSKLENLQLDMTGKRCGGIMVLFADNVTITGCNIRNWRGEFPGLHGIEVLASKNGRIENNTLTNGDYAINVYVSDGTFVQGNFINLMFHGGIYTVFTQRMVVSKNTVQNCGDVGVDSEGGANNAWTGNIVTRCKNGEAAIFSGKNVDSYVSHHLVFSKNQLTRVSQYTVSDSLGAATTVASCDAAKGACTIMSLDEGCYESGFEDNIITVDFGLAFFHEQLADKSNRSIFFRNNTITTSAGLWRCLNSDGLRITGNEITCKAGTEAQQNETRDMHAGLIARNNFIYENAKTSGYAILLNTSSTWATTGPTVEFNTFRGANGMALQYDPFQNSSLVATIRENSFGSIYTTSGGLSITANGTVRLIDQHLKVLLPSGNTDFSALDWVARMSGAGKGVGELGYGRAGFNGTLANVYVVKGNGNVNMAANVPINAGGDGQTLLTVSASGGSLILTNNTGATTSAQLDLLLNTY